jgi:cell division septal protein FtsQ
MSNYEIQPYTYKKLKELNKKLKETLSIFPSKNKKYKIDVYNKNTFLFSIGSAQYEDYAQYLSKYGKEFADERKTLYYKRHKDYPKYTKGYISAFLLW